MLHLHTIKPLDVESLLAHAENVPVIVPIEEHSIIGGLGGAVAEVIAEAGFEPSKRFKRIGIPDMFPDEYGNQASLLDRFSINAENLILTVIALSEGRSQPISSAKTVR